MNTTNILLYGVAALMWFLGSVFQMKAKNKGMCALYVAVGALQLSVAALYAFAV